jgi:hypothetical protein
MKVQKSSPLRKRTIEDIHIRGLAEATRRAHVRHMKLFAAFHAGSPDTATPEDLLRTWQLQMTRDRCAPESAVFFGGGDASKIQGVTEG